MLILHKDILKESIKYSFVLLFLGIVLRIIEIVYLNSRLMVPDNFIILELLGFFFDLRFWAFLSLIYFLLTLLLFRVNKKLNIALLHLISFIYFLSGVGLIVFFAQRAAPLDHELFTTPFADVLTTIKSSQLISFKLMLLVLLLVFAYALIHYGVSRIKLPNNSGFAFLPVWLIGSCVYLFISPNYKGLNYSENKMSYLIKRSYNYWFNKETNLTIEFNSKMPLTDELRLEIETYQKNNPFKYISPEYPFLRKASEGNFLEDYIEVKEKPNIVIIIAESLSRDISGPNAHLGNFLMPFIDSLSDHSLYWENCLSTSAISFEALPSLLGSLPYGKNGFNMIPVYPSHFSLMQILNNNGYHTSFITGTPMQFDNQGSFMRYQGTDYMSYSFPEKYKTMAGEDNWSWGYPDEAIFNYGLERLEENNTSPYLNVYVTITTHPPYVYSKKEHYQEKFDRKLKQQSFSKQKQSDLLKIKERLSTFMYMDDEIKAFFEKYKKRPEYSNTIFVITGDHHGYFNTKNELAKFHVPLIIYSPLLKRVKRFKTVVTHQDLTPSLLNILDKAPDFKSPDNVHWLGDILDTASHFQINRSLALVNWNKSIDYYLEREYFLFEENLYRIKDRHLNLEKIEDEAKLQEIKDKLQRFKLINNYVCYGNALIPDSVAIKKQIAFEPIFLKELPELKKTDAEFPLTVRFNLKPTENKMKVQSSFKIKISDDSKEAAPKIIVSIQEASDKKLFYESKDLKYLNNEIVSDEWFHLVLNDVIDVENIDVKPGSEFLIYIHNPKRKTIEIKDFKVQVMTKNN